jgi:hypothetical protein
VGGAVSPPPPPPAATYVCRFSRSHAFARSSSSSTTRASRSHIGSVQNILITPFSSVTRSTLSSRSGLMTRPHASDLAGAGDLVRLEKLLDLVEDP